MPGRLRGAAEGSFRLGLARGGLFLAAGLLGDLLTVVLGVVPIGLAGVVAALRDRRWRVGLPALTAALGSLVLAEAVRRIAWAIGTYTIGAANPRASFHQMAQNLVHVITWGAALEGVGSRPFGSPGVPPVLGVAHAVGLVLIVLAVFGGLVAIVTDVLLSTAGTDDVSRSDDAAGSDHREAAWFGDVLVFGFFGGCATFVWFSFSSVAPFGRYLVSAVIFGSILGARLAGKLAERVNSGWPRVALAGVAGLVAIGYATTFVNTLTTAPPAQTAVSLATYLEQHHLTKGIGDYWQRVDRDGGILRLRCRPAGRHAQRGSHSQVRKAVDLDVVRGRIRVSRLQRLRTVGRCRLVVSPSVVRAAAARGQGRSYRVATWAHDLTIRGDGTYAPQPWAQP